MKDKNKVLLLIIALILILAALKTVQQEKTSSQSVYPAPDSSAYPASSPLTKSEKWILAPPPATASSSLKQKHAETVAKLAQTGSVLAIKGCQPQPLVLAVKQGSQLQIRNEDSVPRKIMIDEEHTYELSPQGSTTISANFKYGTGDYGYVCKGEGLVGFLHVTS